MSEERIDKIAERFLQWELPEDFRPDCGISFQSEYNLEHMAAQGKPPMRYTPTGTNLFTKDQAIAMIEYILGDEIQTLQQKLEAKEARIKELEEADMKQQQIIDKASEFVCLRCLFTEGYDPEPEPVCCGGFDQEYGCCGCPDPDWRACSECNGTRTPPNGNSPLIK